jgi:hypothetical protein
MTLAAVGRMMRNDAARIAQQSSLSELKQLSDDPSNIETDSDLVARGSAQHHPDADQAET